MKKRSTVFLCLLCAAAMLFPTMAAALSPGDYATTAEPLRNDAFADYMPTYSGTTFTGYPGPYTVGSFPLSSPSKLTTFYQLDTTFTILCESTGASGSGSQWSTGGMYLGGSRGRLAVPASGYAVAVSYHAPKSGIVNLSLDELEASADYKAVFRSKFAIFLNGVKIWPTSSNTEDEHGFYVFTNTAETNAGTRVSYKQSAAAYESFPTALSVQEGDVISFAMANVKSNMGYLKPRVTYTTYCGETYAFRESFYGLQGGGGYYAGYSPKNSAAVYAMPTYDEEAACFGGKSGAGTIGKQQLTVESGCDTVLLFRSPLIATYNLTAAGFTTTGDAAFTATIYRADGSRQNIKQKNYTAASTAFEAVENIALDRGDVLAMRFSAAGSRTVSFAPVMSSCETVYATSQNGEAMLALLGGFALAPDIHIDAVSASLSGDIRLNFYTYFSTAMLTGAEEYGLLLFPEGVTTDYTYQSAYAHHDGALDAASGEYRYTYAGIAAKEMTDLIYARPYVKTASGYTYGELRVASVANYANTLRTTYAGKTTDTATATYALACAMLNYGAAAQQYFSYKTDAPANSGLPESEKTVPAGTYTDDRAMLGSSTLPNYAFYAASMILADLPAIRLYITAATGKTMEGVAIEASLSPDFSTCLPLSAPVWSETNHAYYVTLEGIAPTRMRTPYYFRIRSGQETSQTLVYSAEAYAARCQKNNYDSLATIHAMFAYADAAIAYAEAAGQTSEGIEITAAALADAIRRGTVVANATYYITDLSPLTFSAVDNALTYDGKGITIHSASPVHLYHADGLTLTNLHLVSHGAAEAILLENSTHTTLENITVSGTATVGLAARAAVDDVFLRDLQISGTIGTGISFSGTVGDIYLLESTIVATSLALSDAGSTGAYLQGNHFTSSQNGVKLATTGSELRDNFITAPGSALTITGAKDTLAARNTITGNILCEESDNVVLLKNSAAALTASGNKHLYTVSNTLSGRMTLQNNNYLLADLNSEAAVTASGNQNSNGDDVTAVNARLACGADENLLPHVDKDQFTFHDRKETLRTENGNNAGYNRYILDTLRTEDEVILAPGAYKQYGGLSLHGLTDKTIYAFGVMAEQQNRLNSMIGIASGTKNLSIIGLTIGFARQSCGQVYVLEKLENNTLLVVSGAGMINEFGNTNAEYYDTTGMGAQRPGTFYAYADIGFQSITKNDDGTMNIEVTAGIYNMIGKGDILTCRAAGGGTTVTTSGASGVQFRDMVIYGNAGGFAFSEWGNMTATTYYRVADTTKSGAVISKEEYDRYRALESTYGISTEVYVDENGNYRGSLPHIGSIDATHTTACKEGSQATSCLFENMCDDGTNQNSSHARLDEWERNEDGTITLTYKGNLSEYSYSYNKNKPSNPSGLCYSFSVGDRVYIYTSKGQLVCDEPALSVTEEKDTVTFNWSDHGETDNTTTGTVKRYTVTIQGNTFNPSALEGYDLKNNSWRATHKVLVDNMSMASSGFLFDNTLVRNIRSRGLLIKTSRATIKNCSLINIGMGAIAIHYEIYWGESGVTEDLTVQNNLIQNTGYFRNTDICSPISIYGLNASETDDDFLLYKNITITGNRITDRTTNYAVYVNSVKGVTIASNTFGPRKGYTNDTDNSPAIHINAAKDVTISGNTYPAKLQSAVTRVVMENAVGVDGTDINGALYSEESASAYRPLTSGTTVTYQGNWDYGYMPKSALSFTPYNNYSTKHGGWLTDSSDSLWGGYGGLFATNEYRVAPQSNYHTAMRYTVRDTGTVHITLSDFKAPTNTNSEGYFAIFLNNRMIWPNSGSYYGDTSKWYTITPSTAASDLQFSIASTLSNLSVTEGDYIYFITRQKSNWCNMAITPCIIHQAPQTAESSVLAVGNANWPSYTAPTSTGASFNGSFNGFNGKWSMGSIPAAGGSYTPYGALFNNSQSILIPSGAQSAWSQSGVYLPSGRLALVSGYATVFSYKATKPGAVDLSVSNLAASSDKACQYGAKFAIFVNEKRVWPSASNANDPNGYYVYTGTEVTSAGQSLSFLAAAQAYEAFPTSLSIKAGDRIHFAMMAGSSEMGYCTPCVTYP